MSHMKSTSPITLVRFLRRYSFRSNRLNDAPTLAILSWRGCSKRARCFTMTEPSKDYTTESLRLAREMLRDANLMLENDSYRSAIDRAYYAMFHAVRAALHKEGVEIPKTHAGLRNLFGQHFLTTGKLPKDLGRSLGQTFRLRFGRRTFS